MTFLSKLQAFFCQSPKPSPEAAERIVDELIELGFLKFVAESDKASVRTQLVDSVKNNYLDSEWDDECVSADKRSYPADAEDLAEGYVGECLLKMKEVLTQEGVTLENVEDDFGEDCKSYQVMIDGTGLLINANLFKLDV